MNMQRVRSLARTGVKAACGGLVRVLPRPMRRILIEVLRDHAVPTAHGIEAREDDWKDWLSTLGEEGARGVLVRMAQRTLSVRGRLLLRLLVSEPVPLQQSAKLPVIVPGAPDDTLIPAMLTRQPHLVEWITHYMAQAHVCFDLGAGAGAFALMVGHQLKPRGRVYAFEAAFPQFDTLNRSIAGSKLYGIVVPIPLAPGEHTTLGTLHLSGLYSGPNPHALGRPVTAVGETARVRATTQVLTCRLDDAVELFQLPAPNHLRVAAHGRETEVLRGAVRTLDDPRLLTVMVDLWLRDGREAEVTSTMRMRGFREVGRFSGVLGTPGVAPEQVLFVRD